MGAGAGAVSKEKKVSAKGSTQAVDPHGAQMSAASTRLPCIGMSTTIGTHNGSFQADEALGVWLLRLLPEYKGAKLVRSRDPSVLKPLTIVIDVGGLYDHSQLRYDHHQRGFFETFDGENKESRDGGRTDVTGPGTATGKYKTKLSASGLVYKHYGREMLCVLYPELKAPAIRYTGSFAHPTFGEVRHDINVVAESSSRGKWTALNQTTPISITRDGGSITLEGDITVFQGIEGEDGIIKGEVIQSGVGGGTFEIKQLNREEKADKLEWVYDRLYHVLMEGLDAIDNGIEIADEPRYKEGSGLSTRVARLNAWWNAPAGGPTEDELFEKASALCGAEFSSALNYIVGCELPARVVVEEALLGRSAADSCGQVIILESACPWRTHLYDLERHHVVQPLIKFVLYTDKYGIWRVEAVTQEGTSFINRLGLLEAWRGLKDDALSTAAGIKGCIFCHTNGFIGGHSSKEGALAMALKTIQAAS